MKCISCDSEKFLEYSKKSYLNIPVYQCDECKLIVTGKTKNEVNDAISSIYSNEFWDEQKEIYGNIDNEFTDIISKSKQRDFISQFKFCKSFFQNRKKILEIGSGTGHTIFWLDQKGFHVTGIEPDLQNVISINPKLKNSKIIHCYIDDFTKDEKYEIIWMSHVFEHLAEPDIFLENIKNKISEDGVFFLEVPNCDHSPTLKDSIFGSPHVYHFTSKTIIDLCKKHNFEIITCKIFRPANKIEGILNKLFRNIIKIFPYYPRIECGIKQGRDLRIMLKMIKN
ncbi:MAG: hypothetical protein COA77_03445 [Thaumarchaeota archaeon]|nr:MAG: hypothetical protein COA77_03445 [Nitrososphaerota archaeon]